MQHHISPRLVSLARMASLPVVDLGAQPALDSGGGVVVFAELVRQTANVHLCRWDQQLRHAVQDGRCVGCRGGELAVQPEESRSVTDVERNPPQNDHHVSNPTQLRKARVKTVHDGARRCWPTFPVVEVMCSAVPLGPATPSCRRLARLQKSS
jgi:hypothetical protein